MEDARQGFAFEKWLMWELVPLLMKTVKLGVAHDHRTPQLEELETAGLAVLEPKVSSKRSETTSEQREGQSERSDPEATEKKKRRMYQ